MKRDTVLREIQGVRQDNPGLRRRWYQDEFFDLYTWHAPDGRLAGFQLCYDLRGLLAASVADGTADIDWAQLEASVEDAEDRQLLQDLRVLAGVAELHRSDPVLASTGNRTSSIFAIKSPNTVPLPQPVVLVR